MRTGRPIPPLTLTDAERETLERWARREKTAQAVALRARLIPGCATGRTNTVVAHELRVTKQTVGKWRHRFVARRLDGLLDEPRPGAPRTITDAQVERVLTRALESTPFDGTPRGAGRAVVFSRCEALSPRRLQDRALSPGRRRVGRRGARHLRLLCADAHPGRGPGGAGSCLRHDRRGVSGAWRSLAGGHDRNRECLAPPRGSSAGGQTARLLKAAADR